MEPPSRLLQPFQERAGRSTFSDELAAARAADVRKKAIAVHFAAKIGDHETLNALLQDELVSITVDEARDAVGATPLHTAAQNAQLEMARWLLAEGGADANAATQSGYTALHYAGHAGDVALARLLLAEGASTEAVTRWGETPLILVANTGNLTMVRELVGEDLEVPACNVEHKTKRGYTASMVAQERGHLETVDFLRGGEFQVNLGRQLRELLVATRAGDADRARELLALDGTVSGAAGHRMDGNDPRARDERDHSPLFWACHDGHAEIAEALVISGADVEAQSNMHSNVGDTPLTIGALRGNFEVLEVLVNLGQARISHANRDGCTPLHAAAMRGIVRVAKWLVSKGGDTEALDSRGRRPRDVAVQQGQTDVAEWFTAFDNMERD